MFIHFAFGQLGKQGMAIEQTTAVIDFILSARKLKASLCTEFIPDLPQPGKIRIPLEDFKLAEPEFKSDGSVIQRAYKDIDLKELSESPENFSIYYQQRPVSMVCFIRIAFNSLRGCNHWKEYGKLGIVLSDRFLKSKGIRPVEYYTEESLWHDPLIRKWNYEPDKRRECEKEILAFRKPATYFPAFKKSAIAKLTADPKSGGRLEFLKYDRYEVDYDFTREQEHRIVFDADGACLSFEESDLFMVIAPNIEAQRRIQDFFIGNWEIIPQVVVYPI